MFEQSRLRFAVGLFTCALLFACKDDPAREGSGGSGAPDDGASGGAAAGRAGNLGSAGSNAGSSGATGTDEPADAGTDVGTDADAYQPFASGSFSAEHMAEIQKDCQETLQCLAQMGQELPDDPMQQCLQDSAMVLDQRGESLQTSFLTKFERCSELIVCDYYNCVTSTAGG